MQRINREFHYALCIGKERRGQKYELNENKIKLLTQASINNATGVYAA